MAIEWDLRFRDMLYGIGGRPYDHRIEIGGWTYYVLPRLWKCDVRFESQVQDEVPSIDSVIDWLALWLLRVWDAFSGSRGRSVSGARAR